MRMIFRFLSGVWTKERDFAENPGQLGALQKIVVAPVAAACAHPSVSNRAEDGVIDGTIKQFTCKLLKSE